MLQIMLKKFLQKIKILGTLCMAAILFPGSDAGDTRLARIRDTLSVYMGNHPQQKVYLHLDRSAYHSGEIIWFKAYLVNGTHHRPDSFSTNLYVELIGPEKTRVEIKRIRMSYGFGTGDFSLSDTLPEGLYQLRAFTNWMQNFHPDFCFSRNFQIRNPFYRKLISPQQARENLKETKKQQDIHPDIYIQFYPEGGNLVNGLESRVAFKALNKQGIGMSVEGIVYDSRENRITEFKTRHDGMGSFLLNPKKGEKYTALVSTDIKDYRFDLPQPLEYGIVMKVENRGKDIQIGIGSNKPPTSERVANEVIIVGQVRGNICFEQIANLADGPVLIAADKTHFPAGIVQFTLFSGRMIPLAERLVFVNHNDHMRIRLQAYDTITENEDRLINLSLATQDKFMKPLASHLSVAVLYDNNQEIMLHENILSYFLLTSDLRGYIRHPDHYLQDALSGKGEDMDLLMLTHGWRKFDWTEIMNGHSPKLRFFEEKGITIAGLITTELFSIPLKNCKVKLSIAEEYNDVFTQLTGDKGIFKFENLVYYDTINVKIEAWRSSGRKNLVIVVPDDEFMPVTKHEGETMLTTVSERDKKAYRKERFNRESLALEEERKRIAAEDSNKLHGIYGEPDAIIRSEDIPSGYRDALQVIQGRVPGVMVTGDQVQIRGMSTFYGNTQPLYLIDGVPATDVSTVLAIPVEDIDRIEIIKGPSSAIYGSRGGNGIIAIYTKRGMFLKKGILEFQMLGYYWPRKFYQPIFESNEKPDEIETIVWEPLVITDASGKARILFRKPEWEGKFRIIVEGISSEGHPGFTNLVLENH